MHLKVSRYDENSLMRFLLPLRAGLPLIYVKLACVLNGPHFLMQAEESFDFQREEKERQMLFQLLVNQRNVHRVNSEQQHLFLALLLLCNNFEKHFLMLVFWAFCVKSCWSQIRSFLCASVFSPKWLHFPLINVICSYCLKPCAVMTYFMEVVSSQSALVWFFPLLFANKTTWNVMINIHGSPLSLIK